MGCFHTKSKSSQCNSRGSWNQRDTQKLSTFIHKPKNQNTKWIQEEYHRPSQDIFTVAHRMSSSINQDHMIDPPIVKKFKTNDGKIQTVTNTANIYISEHKVNRQRRGKTLDTSGKFRGCIVWFTGLSGAGKSTISMGVEEELVSRGISCYCLDGDNLRAGLCKDLTFSLDDRNENIRRAIEAAILLADSGQVVLCSLISPNREERGNARGLARNAKLPFFEVYIDTPLEVCEERDTKGLYRKARNNEIKDFTGIHQEYEKPNKPELTLETVNRQVEACVNDVVQLLQSGNIIPTKLPVKINGDQYKPSVIELFAKDTKVKNMQNLYSVKLTQIDLQWVQVLSEGWASPLTGFMKEDQYLQCLHFKCLLDGEISNQSIPIVLPISNEDKSHIKKSDSIILKYNDEVIAVMEDVETFPHRKEERIARQFGTSHPGHPYIKIINESGDWLVGGNLRVFNRIKWNDGLDTYRLTPNELKEKYEKLGADVIFAFQLRNPIHNGHALLIKDCQRQLEEKGYKKPVLLLHPLGGFTKEDDVPLDVRIIQHRAILEEHVLDPNSTILAIFPSPMMYAGPTEVQWHAKARLVAGVNYYIVGRDPAGMKHPNGENNLDLYDSTHGGRVLSMAPGLDSMTILKFRPAAYDTKQHKMDFIDNNREKDFLKVSGTDMRDYARNGKTPPQGFMAPKAWEVLADYYKKQNFHTNGQC